MATTLENAAKTLAHYIRLSHDDQGELDDVIEAFRQADKELSELRKLARVAVLHVEMD